MLRWLLGEVRFTTNARRGYQLRQVLRDAPPSKRPNV